MSKLSSIFNIIGRLKIGYMMNIYSRRVPILGICETGYKSNSEPPFGHSNENSLFLDQRSVSQMNGFPPGQKLI